VQTFSVNDLNELSSVTRSGTLTVAGTSSSTATSVIVAYNGNSPVNAVLYSDKTFARTNVTILNGNNTFTAVGTDSYGRRDTNAITCNLPSTVSYAYDGNGNLTSDGTRAFSYDDENQLTRVTVTNSWRSEFVYDGKFRRRIRKEYSWINSAFVQTNEVRYVYDSNNVVQERDGNNFGTVFYIRTGLRLLARTDQGSGQTAFYHADGNCNITAMVNAQQAIVARYSYDPYGNILSKSGPLADANLFRFSSKELHPNSGLIYFGRRFYEPNLQRWVNRDPISEQGGINLFLYVGNNPISLIDPLGFELIPYGPGQYFGNPGPYQYYYGNTFLSQAGAYGMNAASMIGNTAYQVAAGASQLIGMVGGFFDWGSKSIGITKVMGSSPTEALAAINPGLFGEFALLRSGVVGDCPQVVTPGGVPTLRQTALQGIADNMLVHFSQLEKRASIVENGLLDLGTGINFFKVGDVADITAQQVRGAIGWGAQGGLENSLAVIVSPDATSLTKTIFTLPEYTSFQLKVPWTLIREVPGGVGH
jgi:RHS repeat-associated protein